MLHWWSQRLSAVLLIPMVVLLEPATLGVLAVVLFYHINVGMETVLHDYVQHPKTKALCFLMLRLCILCCAKYLFTWFIL